MLDVKSRYTLPLNEAPGKGFEPLSADAQPLSCIRFRGGRRTTWLTWQFPKTFYLNIVKPVNFLTLSKKLLDVKISSIFFMIYI